MSCHATVNKIEFHEVDHPWKHRGTTLSIGACTTISWQIDEAVVGRLFIGDGGCEVNIEKTVLMVGLSHRRHLRVRIESIARNFTLQAKLMWWLRHEVDLRGMVCVICDTFAEHIWVCSVPSPGCKEHNCFFSLEAPAKGKL